MSGGPRETARQLHPDVDGSHTYGTFSANGNTAFVLGAPGAVEPAVYNLQALTLNGAAILRVVGPVIVNVKGGVVFDSAAGAPGHASWLRLNISSAGLIVNGGSVLDGYVVAPTSNVVIRGAITGGVVADRIIITGAGVLNAGGS